MRSTVAVSVVFLFGVVAAFAVGQQQPSEREPAGAYAVASIDQGAVLLDKQTGKTWVLQHSDDRLQPSVWLPAVKIDSQEDAARWRKEDQARGVIASTRSTLQREILELKEQLAQYKAIAITTQSGRVNAQLNAIEKRISEREASLDQLQ